MSSNSADAVAPTPSPETKTTGGSANASPVLSTGISIIPPAPSVIILPEFTTGNLNSWNTVYKSSPTPMSLSPTV